MSAPDLVTISNRALTARIDPLGAELWSLTDSAGREYMTDADPAFWTGHAPLLFPIVGALNGGRYRVDGAEHALPKHGFARTSRFELVEREDDRVRFACARATRRWRSIRSASSSRWRSRSPGRRCRWSRR